MKIKHKGTNSERKTRACLFRWLIRYGIGLASKYEAPPLWFGAVWHDVLHRYLAPSEIGYPTNWPNRAEVVHSYLNNLADEQQAIAASFDPSADYRRDPEDALADIALLRRMFDGYHEDFQANPLEVVASEVVVEAPTMAPSGNPSPVSGFAIKLDRLYRIDGRLWLGESKTSSSALEDWRDQHDYQPQTPTYEAVRRLAGLEPCAGVVFDLAYKGAPARPEDYGTNKDGTISLALPANATAAGFAEAIGRAVPPKSPEPPKIGATEKQRAAHEKRLASWKLRCVKIENKLAALRAKPPEFFRREYIPFDNDEIARAGEELYFAATDLRHAHETVAKRGFPWSRTHKSPTFALAALRILGSEFYRNANECKTYGRNCRDMDLCRFMSEDTLRRYRFKRCFHEELEDDDGQQRLEMPF